MFVEVKLWSDYRDRQLDDYLKAASLGDPRTLVASITRNVSRYRKPDKSEPHWLGAIRWARLAPALRDLPRASAIRTDWNILLDVMAADGDLGDLELTQDLIDAWTRDDRATERLTTLLQEVAHDTLDYLREQLAARSGRSAEQLAIFVPLRRASAPRTRADSAAPASIPVKIEANLIWLRFAVPARGRRRFEIGFDIPDQEPRFFIVTEIEAPEELTEAEITAWRAGHRTLKRIYRGFVGADLGSRDDFGVDVAYPLVEFAGRDDVPAKLSDLIHEHIQKFVDSGIFDGDLATETSKALKRRR